MFYERQPKNIKQEDIKKAFEHAKAEYPRECCGIFTTSSGYIACTNIHKEPNENFHMKEYHKIAANKDDVLAVFHSHPNGRTTPSSEDMKFQISTNLPWGIAALDDKGDVLDCFFWGSKEIPELIGRKYRSGSMDCYSLIRDCYKSWYNINLPEFPRDRAFWEKGENLYIDGFGMAGFEIITSENLMPGDVLLGSILGKGIINHGAVILNEKEIIHHLANKLSKRDPLSKWFQRLNVCLRYSAFNDNGGPPKPPELER